MKTKYDAIVVGSGPNGFAAAITLQRCGLSVLIVEAKDTLGGGVCSAELTLPGFIHDVCSAVYPLGENSPVFKPLQLEKYGLEYLRSEYAVAHPFYNGSAVTVESSIERTAAQLGKDGDNYKRIFFPLVNEWPSLRSAFVGPLHMSSFTETKARFAYYAISSGRNFAKNNFTSYAAQSLFAGMAAHSILPLNKLATASVAIVLNTVAHINSWPVPKGGAQQITKALAAYFKAKGGEIQTGHRITSLHQLPSSRVVLLDVTPAQLLSIANQQFSDLYKWQLSNYQYGEGVFKIDWALSQPAPFTNEKCRKATTVHLGGSFDEIYQSEYLVSKKRVSDKP